MVCTLSVRILPAAASRQRCEKTLSALQEGEVFRCRKRVRKYTKLEPIEEAVDHAVMECIREGILSDFLQEQRAEVVSMSIFEYDEEEEKRKLREAYREEAREEAREEIREEVREEVKEEVREEVKEEVREEFLGLMQSLIAQGRGNEIERILTEEAYRDRVWKEFSLAGEPRKQEE